MRQTPRTAWWWRAICVAALAASPSFAVEAQLRDGRILVGKMVDLASVASLEIEKSGPKRILCCDDGLRRTYVDETSIVHLPETDNREAEAKIEIRQRPARGGREATQLGIVEPVGSFNQFGHRNVRLPGVNGGVQVVQAITEITPRWTALETLPSGDQLATFRWEMRIGTKLLPRETLSPIVLERSKSLEQRLALTRVYLQSERYHDAVEELTAAIEAFPQAAERDELDRRVAAIRVLASRQLLEEVELRSAAGQHDLALSMLQNFPLEESDDRTKLAVRRDLTNYVARRTRLEQFKTKLDEHVERLDDEAVTLQIAAIRDEIRSEISLNTIDRMGPYLLLVDDESQALEDRLALAVSGWLLGAEGALDDLDVAFSLVRVRDAIVRYLRSERDQERTDALLEMTSQEGAQADLVAKLLANIKPPLDRPEPHREIAGYYETSVEGPAGVIPYVVQLPWQYDPQVAYPTVVMLPAPHQSVEEAVAWWCGEPNEAGERIGQAGRRGWIVVVVDWRAPRQTSYEGGGREHAAVLFALRDAMRRFHIDSDRVFLAGSSTGGDVAWDVAVSHPDLWAGLVAYSATASEVVRYYHDNAAGLPMYFVVGELDGGRMQANYGDFDYYLTHVGYDAQVEEYLGRGHEDFPDDRGEVFDWMGRRSRETPRREFEVATRRAFDRFFWWAEFDPPQPSRGRRAVRNTKLTGQILGNNSIRVTPAIDSTVWLTPEMVDFGQVIEISFGGRSQRLTVVPSVATLLEDARTRADRKHPYWAKVDSPRRGGR